MSIQKLTQILAEVLYYGQKNRQLYKYTTRFQMCTSSNIVDHGKVTWNWMRLWQYKNDLAVRLVRRLHRGVRRHKESHNLIHHLL